MDIDLLFNISSLVFASRSPLSFLTRKLVGCNPNIQDVDGDTPLHTCDKPSIAQLLLSSKADPSLRNNMGKTMLEQAIELENDDMVEFWQGQMRHAVSDTTNPNTIHGPLV
jgi:hypothetical protein